MITPSSLQGLQCSVSKWHPGIHKRTSQAKASNTRVNGKITIFGFTILLHQRISEMAVTTATVTAKVSNVSSVECVEFVLAAHCGHIEHLVSNRLLFRQFCDTFKCLEYINSKRCHFSATLCKTIFYAI